MDYLSEVHIELVFYLVAFFASTPVPLSVLPITCLYLSLPFPRSRSGRALHPTKKWELRGAGTRQGTPSKQTYLGPMNRPGKERFWQIPDKQEAHRQQCQSGCRLVEGSQRPNFRSWLCHLVPGQVTIILWNCNCHLFTTVDFSNLISNPNQGGSPPHSPGHLISSSQ